MCGRGDEERCPKQPEARYANYFKAGFNSEEVVIDLGQGYRDDAKVDLHTRIVTSPAYAKDLAELLQETLGDYESAYGPIARGREQAAGSAGKRPAREDG